MFRPNVWTATEDKTTAPFGAITFGAVAPAVMARIVAVATSDATDALTSLVSFIQFLFSVHVANSEWRRSNAFVNMPIVG